MNQEVKTIVDGDINRCDDVLKGGGFQDLDSLERELKSKYGTIIDGFKDGLYRLHYDNTGQERRKNIAIMKRKLELFRAMGYENHYSDRAASVIVNNTNHAEANFIVSFTDVRKTVENMSALRESEIQEVLSKIEELEKIVSSTERKSKKWERAKDIIKWIADKSVDVGIALLPLILKIGQ